MFKILAITIAALAGAAAMADTTTSVNEATAIDQVEMLVADNRRRDRRDDRQEERPDRRDDRQDCREEDGLAGGDKRDCKQEERHGDAEDEEQPENA